MATSGLTSWCAFENVLKELLWQASTNSVDMPPEDLSADDFCTTLLSDALSQVTPLCNANTSPSHWSWTISEGGLGGLERAAECI